MSREVCIFLADGFEEVEGLTVVDLLRRAGVDIDMVSITGEFMVHGARGIDVRADALFEDQEFDSVRMLILPGGMPGTLHLGAHEGLKQLLLQCRDRDCYLAAICAAPTILGEYGIIEGKRAVCYPGLENKLKGAILQEDAVVEDGHVITSKGLGTAIPFALKLIEILCGKEKARDVGKSIVYDC